ncbi:MAG: hypothetical protein A2X42_04970 [Candidatus Margulisbacteria bacterium GWF2_38_17]|nr:MAG: hypothetical protein A2X42_04970 [Candidatus Margulisbacteria bacterium GWF2_38_17]
MITKKKIIIGICGGIAAYKVASIVNNLIKNNNQVQVVMTKAATQLVNPNTFRALSRLPVITELFADSDEPVPHISLADEYDALVVIPATANMIAKAAHGIADDALSTLIVSFHKPVLFVPAMNTKMLDNPIVRRNVDILRQNNYSVLEPESGYLACGTYGAGRLPDESRILLAINNLFSQKDLTGKMILITSGGTREYIDDVRFISNASSGKMGLALVQEALSRGARIVLVSTIPVAVVSDQLTVLNVTTADEMFRVVDEQFSACDVFIAAAAVADFKIKNVVEGKIKKDQLLDGTMNLTLIPNPDILKNMGEKKSVSQVLVGFCLESCDLITNAYKKLEAKHCDLIIANSPEAIGAECSEIVILTGSSSDKYHADKQELAKIIFDQIINKL